MKLSPALLLKQRKLARLEISNIDGNQPIAPQRPDESEGATEYELLLAALGEDLNKLSNISSTDAKSLYKIEAMEKFTPYINGVIAAITEHGKAMQDEIFARMMVWNFDIGEYSKCLEMADLMIKYGINMPQGFNLDSASWLCSNIGEKADNCRVTGEGFPLAVLQHTEELIKNLDISDKHRAKLEKGLGFGFLKIAEDLKSGERTESLPAELKTSQEMALSYFQAATRHKADIGVKKEMERLISALK